MTAQEIVSQLTLEEKASLCSGKDFWTLKSVEPLGLSSIMVTDGPHGLRKQEGSSDQLGINRSVPATCFPAASGSVCSFSRELLYQIGQAMGEECLQEQVSVILGPGVNIKRSPLCGRNFEYFSEDPYITGELAAALIQGVQSTGVGTSLKHYAVNNQEKSRFTCNSVVDERALREIYLTGFEIAVKKAQPWTIMCSYNQVNGLYASEHKKLLTDILRDEWGFTGLVMTDWGAVNERVEGIKAGLDLEMPGSGGFNDAKIVEAVKNGSLDEGILDKTALRLVELILNAQQNRKAGYRYDKAAHHELARKAARESAVLLKNNGDLLPIKQGQGIAVIGAFAKIPRYQGAGSSKINPTQLDSAVDALKAEGVSFEYAPGYTLTPDSAPDPKLIEEACAAAKGKDHAIIFAGLPDEYESEGFDRTTLAMPESHNQLIQAVAKVNPNTSVVLHLGAPVLIPWAQEVKAVLVMYLGGQAAGSAAADLLLGKTSPSGKLAETWPLALEDTPCHRCYPGTARSAEYRESIFVGYRYYDHGNKPVAYPFGYGLSYTQFEYGAMEVSDASFKAGDTLEVSFSIKNTGKVGGAEIAQVYVSPKNTAIFRGVKELKGFERVFLQSGETKTLNITLNTHAFAYYNVPKAGWAVESGEYEILVGASSRDIRLRGTVQVIGDGCEQLLRHQRKTSPEYFDLQVKELAVGDSSFEALYGRKLPPAQRDPQGRVDLNSTLEEVRDRGEAGKKLSALVSRQMAAAFGNAETNDLRLMMERMINEMPLRSLMMMSGGTITPGILDSLVAVLNGQPCTDPALSKLLDV
ncbi:MAG: glycoside hydrolase family 3 C-terminal domain-containing protein [Treponema sp.]|jgi:beta-glucosidase|nr:glycoside hydrolase family 3 C-terminal domain-containing protein [Treponema sp.]